MGITSAIIGIEGGGTKTRAIVVRAGETAYYEWPESVKVAGEDYAASASRIASLLRGVGVERVESLALGLSGMNSAERQRHLISALQSAFPGARIHVEGDATLALKAATGDSGSGILLISGTGSVALARDGSGNIFRAGGYGPPDSDEGSGWWIGKRALASGEWRVENGEWPGGRSFGSENAEIAQAAASVFELARGSDAMAGEARKIIREAALELAKLVRDVTEQAKLSSGEVYLSGSIAQNEVTVSHLRELLPEFELRKLGERAPAEEALEIAKRLAAGG